MSKKKTWYRLSKLTYSNGQVTYRIEKWVEGFWTRNWEKVIDYPEEMLHNAKEKLKYLRNEDTKFVVSRDVVDGVQDHGW
jgi:diphthamide synthase subunit DPH2